MRSFDPDPSVTVADVAGQLAHRSSLDQSRRMVRQLYAVRPGVWRLVGNGLSNQTFIEGPGGLIAIDTGECIEEMESALREVRAHTRAPLVAVLSSYFHYVGGTLALVAQSPRQTLHLLRVMLEPRRAAGSDHHEQFRFSDAPPSGLHVRHCVAVATDGAGAQSTLEISYADLIAALTGKESLQGLIAAERAKLSGEADTALAALASFDIPGFAVRSAQS